MLRVLVGADGSPLQVLVHTSSGYTALDEAAVDTVRHWRFVPARHAGHAVVGWVQVPVRFRILQ